MLASAMRNYINSKQPGRKLFNFTSRCGAGRMSRKDCGSHTGTQTTGSHMKKSQLDGVWELVSGQPLPKGARDLKIISGGHFIFAAYETGNGRPLYAAG